MKRPGDRFKEINDRHGHAAGDMVLTDVAGILSNAVRSSNDLVARYGGDEFVAQLNCPVVAGQREIQQDPPRNRATRLPVG